MPTTAKCVDTLKQMLSDRSETTQGLSDLTDGEIEERVRGFDCLTIEHAFEHG